MAIQFENSVVAGVVLIRDSIQSQNFEIDAQGEITGWQINSDGSSTFTSTTISGPGYGIDDQGVGSFSAVNVDTDIIIDGDSLNNALDIRPTGLVAYGDTVTNNTAGGQWTVNSAAITTTEIALFEFAAGPLLNSRFYNVLMNTLLIQTVATDVFTIRIRYTVDGTAPTTSSNILDGSQRYVTGARTSYNALTIYSPGADYDVVRMQLCLVRFSGTGSISAEMTNPNTKTFVAVQDVGNQGLAVAGASLSQKSKSAGVPDADPVSTYTKTYQCNWSRSWNSSGSDINITNGEISQGQSPATTAYGNRISWIGFPFSTIQSDLSGATVKKVEVYLKYTHWYNNSGGTAVIGTHNSTATSAPSYDASKDNQNRKTVSGWAANSSKWVDITSVVGSEFKTGTSTGIVIGKGVTTSQTYYGKAIGNQGSGEPALRITYTK